MHGGTRVLVILISTAPAPGVLRDARWGERVICHSAALEMSFLEPAGVAFREVHCTLHAHVRLTLGERLTSLDEPRRRIWNVTLNKSQQVSDWGAEYLTREQIDLMPRSTPSSSGRWPGTSLRRCATRRRLIIFRCRPPPRRCGCRTADSSSMPDAHARLVGGAEARATRC